MGGQLSGRAKSGSDGPVGEGPQLLRMGANEGDDTAAFVAARGPAVASVAGMENAGGELGMVVDAIVDRAPAHVDRMG